MRAGDGVGRRLAQPHAPGRVVGVGADRGEHLPLELACRRAGGAAEDAFAVVLEDGPVRRVGGEVVGQPGAGAQDGEQPAAQQPRAAQVREQGGRRSAGGVVAVEGLHQPVQRPDGRGRGRRPGPGRRSPARPRGRPARCARGPRGRARDRTAGRAARSPSSKPKRASRTTARRGISAAALLMRVRRPAARARTRSANRPANGAQASCTSDGPGRTAGADGLAVVRARGDADEVAARPTRG